MRRGPELDRPESRRTVKVFAFASFLNDFGSDIIYPIWPLFVTSVLGANMAVLGFIDGLGDAIVSLSQAGSGYISDRIRKRKIFIWVGYLFGSLSRIGYALSTVWQHLIPLRVLDRMGKIRSAPRDAIVADISTDQDRGRNFGLLRTMDNLGAVCGILFCLVFFHIGYQNLFLLAAVPSAIGAALILWMIKEQPEVAAKAFKGLSLGHLDRNFWLFLVLSSFFALGSFSYSFLLIYSTGFGVRESLMPVLYLVFTVVAALLSLPCGRLADRFGRKPILLLSFLAWGFTCFVFAVFQNAWMTVVAFVLFGVHKAALEPVQKALVSELAPRELRASTLGGFQMVIGLCAFPSSLLAGLVWQYVDRIAPLYLSLVLTVLSSVLLLFVKERRSVNT
ncbi:MAG: MFS transporter [Ignavibacteria bacterium]|nr:MFS transporter [Ignavibacteria bacterium]